MAALGAFLSIAAVVFGRSVSEAILLSAPAKINIANFFIYSSLAMMAVSVIYFRLIRVVSASKLNAGFMLLFAVASIACDLLYTTDTWYIQTYATFLITAPALGNIIIWNAIGDAFNARQGRRLFNIVCASSTTGGIVAGFVIPLLLNYVGFACLPIVYSLLFLLSVVPIVILHRNRRSERTILTVVNEKSDSLFREMISGCSEFIKSPLIRNLCVVFFLTAITTNVIDFSLKDYLRTNYDKDGIATFNGIFNAISNSFNLIVQLTLLSSFLTRFRTRTLFAITPITLLIFTMPFLFVYSAIGVILMRFMDVALRFVIQDAAREIALSPLPRLIRNRAKVIFKGVMNPIGGIFAGIMINVLQPVLGMQYLALLVIPISLCSLWCVRNLNRYCANHLYAALQNSASKEGLLTIDNDTHDDDADLPEITDPQTIADPDDFVRMAALDNVLVVKMRDEEAATSEEVRQYTSDQISHDVHLAHAVISVQCALSEQFADQEEDCLNAADSIIDCPDQPTPEMTESDDAQAPLNTAQIIEELPERVLKIKNPEAKDALDALSSFYGDAFQRIFKGLMVLYKHEIIATIYQSLASTRSSTRAQALELLQLTVANSPHVKEILILCDDLDRAQKAARLNDITPLSVCDALAVLHAEQSRQFKRLADKLDALLIKNEL